MEIKKEFSRKLLFWVILIIGLSCVILDAVLYLGIRYVSEQIMNLVGLNATMGQLWGFVQSTSKWVNQFSTWYVPVSAGISILIIFLMWFFIRLSLNRLVEQAGIAEKEASAGKPPTDRELALQEEESKKRLYLHLISVLQREGRLLDFFSENLDDYEDEAIGAAVRTIHENCKKAMEKYLTLAPVIDTPEEEEMEIPSGFDPARIKLLGNVAGDPPFKGVVQHRGWRAEKIELPTLSGTKASDILAPAEVEIP